MCPTPDAPANGHEEMVPIDTQQPSLPPPAQTKPNGKAENGHSHPPAVQSHKGVYGRASDFLSNTSNWKVGIGFIFILDFWRNIGGLTGLS